MSSAAPPGHSDLLFICDGSRLSGKGKPTVLGSSAEDFGSQPPNHPALLNLTKNVRSKDKTFFTVHLNLYL